MRSRKDAWACFADNRAACGADTHDEVTRCANALSLADVAPLTEIVPDHVTEVTRQLSHVPLFEGLRSDVLEQIVALAHPRPVDAVHFFFNEGDQATEFFVLTSGRVKLTQLTPEGHQVVLRVIGPG